MELETRFDASSNNEINNQHSVMVMFTIYNDIAKK